MILRHIEEHALRITGLGRWLFYIEKNLEILLSISFYLLLTKCLEKQCVLNCLTPNLSHFPWPEGWVWGWNPWKGFCFSWSLQTKGSVKLPNRFLLQKVPPDSLKVVFLRVLNCCRDLWSGSLPFLGGPQALSLDSCVQNLCNSQLGSGV